MILVARWGWVALAIVACLAVAGCGDSVLRPGVLLPSGLVYQDLEVGTGELAGRGDGITFDYIAKLEDGTVFDSSLETGMPTSIRLGEGWLVPGLDQGIPGMREGGVRRIFIPPRLAYGDSIATIIGRYVLPNTKVIFDVMLRRVVPGTGDPAPRDGP